MGSSLLSVAEQLLKDLQRTYSETNQIPDDLLIALRFVFGQCALQALDLVDQRSVTCVSSPSGRKAFQVLGGSGRLYTCFTSCHYCPCPAFSFSVLRRNESLMRQLSSTLRAHEWRKEWISCGMTTTRWHPHPHLPLSFFHPFILFHTQIPPLTLLQLSELCQQDPV
ncbi:zinc finger SWIM domain-containing protein 7 isoform X1 [Puntigrus tetrazona]|uniref:zinc finger SWIM domain-containing protein 7 isoform X1 n=1 Tax=Puntigrus tetrazona TaxID=1606681 RepID=UPI001C89D46C|nr:zinc finger SWIM domain-containing protein 7 isoform X1 [Puntigrus tetrazona]